jgi:6-phosphogluconolactonase
VLWWGDERFVAADSPHRNVGQAMAAFGDRLGLDRAKVHAVPSTDDVSDVEAAAAAYDEILREHGGGAFEVLMLGMGPDGHVASLFPGKPELEERSRLAVGVPLAGMEPQVPRITVSLPAISSAREAILLVTGENKAATVARVFGPDPDRSLPAAQVELRYGTLTVLLDEAAASQL